MRFYERFVALVLILVFFLIVLRSTNNRWQHKGNSNRGILLDRRLVTYLTKLLVNTNYTGVDRYRDYAIARRGLVPLAGVKSIRPEFGPPINDVTNFRYPISTGPCSRHQHSDGNNLFIAVISAAGYFQKRQTIRQTWGGHLRNISAGFGFIVGRTLNETVQKALEKESSEYGDIVQVDMIDAYANLTLKVTGLLNWLVSYCAEVDFVLKVDDDVYVNVRNLLTTLASIPKNIPAIYGSDIYGNPVERRPEDKWSISYESWPWANYPTVLRGGCILMTGSAIRPLLAAAQVTPFLPFDDVYLSGLCARKAGVQIFIHDGMFDAELVFLVPDSCFVRLTIAWLTTSSKQMVASHEAVSKFYSNVEHCRILSKGINVPADPGEVILFHFRRIDA